MHRLLPLVICVFSVVLAASSHAAEEPTNVVFILADDLGWNDIGYHNAEIRSPHLDAIAAESVRLECHYVQPQCTPTRVGNWKILRQRGKGKSPPWQLYNLADDPNEKRDLANTMPERVAELADRFAKQRANDAAR